MNKIDVKYKKLRPGAYEPTRGSNEAAGMDLRALLDGPINIAPGATVMIPTGLAMEIPYGCFGGLFARSGMASNRGLRPANCVGVSDSDYRGELFIPLHNDSSEVQTINSGDRVAQLIIIPYMEAFMIETNELNETQRGSGGFGSSGIN